MILNAECGCVVGDKIYSVMREMPVLFAYDKKSDEVELIGMLPEEKPFLIRSSRKIIRWNDKLIIVPYNAKYVHIFGLDDNGWKIISLPENKAKDERYIEAVLYKDRVIMIGAEEPNIIELDLQTMKIKVINEYFKSFEIRNGSYCRIGSYIKDNKLYISLAISREVLKMDLDNYGYEVIGIRGGSGGFAGITYDGNEFWLTPRRGGEITKWDGGNRTELYTPSVECPDGRCCFVGAYTLGKMLVFPGFEGKYTVFMDMGSRNFASKEMSFYYTEKNGNEELFGNNRNGEWIIFHEDSEKSIVIETTENEWDIFLKKCGVAKSAADNMECIKENSLYQLNSFLYELKD